MHRSLETHEGRRADVESGEGGGSHIGADAWDLSFETSENGVIYMEYEPEDALQRARVKSPGGGSEGNPRGTRFRPSIPVVTRGEREMS